MTYIHTLGRIRLDHLEKKFGRIQTDTIVITQERDQHIQDNHAEDYELFKQYGAETVAAPDYIITDTKNAGTVFMVRKLNFTNLNVVVRLALVTDKSGLKNSVMTSYRLRDKNVKKLIEKNELLYKNE